MAGPNDGDEEPEALLRAVAGGDPAALERFYRACVDALYTFVFYRVGKDPAAAEDVVQETFLSAMRRPSDFDAKRGTLRGWLCQLSRNVIRAHLKAARRHAEIDMWERLDHKLVDAFARMEREALADELLAQREVQDLVHMAMGHLAEHHRRLLERKYVEDATLGDLSQELGVSEDAVKSMLARARRAFREAFQTLGGSLSEARS